MSDVDRKPVVGFEVLTLRVGGHSPGNLLAILLRCRDD
jgi:hypothetical protein